MSMSGNVGAYRHVRRIRLRRTQQMRVLASAVILSLGFAAASPAVLIRPFVLPHISAAGDPVIAAAGDIACDPMSPGFNNLLGAPLSCHMLATSDIVAAICKRMDSADSSVRVAFTSTSLAPPIRHAG